MRIIAVDDEALALRDLEQAIGQAVPGCELTSFSTAGDTISYAATHAVDVAFLDIEMGGMSGLALAKHLRELNPKTNIVFVTGYPSYSSDAFNLRASGYLLKPVQVSAIENELDNLRYPVAWPERHRGRLQVQCFGNFEVFAGGKPLNFARTKSKELLAYLISRRGASCSIDEIIAVLWEDRPVTRSLKSHLRNLVSDLLGTLRKVGLEDVIQKGWGTLAVVVDRMDCDYYDFYRGDLSVVNRYAGEFMSQYSWAEFSIGKLEQLRG